jgi:hypothetical protein
MLYVDQTLLSAGPKPGWPRAKTSTRGSTGTLVWFAMRGTRRYRGRRISGLWPSSCRFQQ